MLSDQGPQFAAKAFRALMKKLGIKSALSTAYHPQTDRTTERVNQEIEAYLAIYCHSHPESWKKKIPTLEFTHNNSRHAEQHRTPFELMFGNFPWAILTTFKNTKFPSIDEQLKQLVKDREEALVAHELTRMKMAEQRRSTYKPFKLGQKVWLDTRNVKMKYHGKMAPKREGPFKIEVLALVGTTFMIKFRHLPGCVYWHMQLWDISFLLPKLFIHYFCLFFSLLIDSRQFHSN